MNMLKRSAAILLALALCGTAWAGRAGTPDARGGGHALTQEVDVCGSLIGATPGLYGMCVAYCKAPELDDAGLSADKLQAIAERKEQVLTRYHETMQDGDPEMPCVKQDACPCWTSTQTSVSFWLDRSGTPRCGGAEMPPVVQRGIAGGTAAENDMVRMVAYSNSEISNYFCSYTDQATGESSVQTVSDTDALVCATQIQATCSLLQ